MGLGIDKIWQMIGNQKESNKATYAKATVLRRDNDGTIWVKIEGGVDETPVYSTTANVKPNDVVTVKVAGGKVYIEGSTSSPSVGVTEFGDAVININKNVKKVDDKAGKAAEDSEAALAAAKAAEEATDVARVTSQHFWVNDDEPETYGGAGAHVTEQEKEDWAEAIRRRFPDLSDEKPYHNILMNSLGILLRTALNNLVSITRSAIAFFDGEGNNSENIVASFGKDGAQVGSSETANMFIDSTHVTGASSEGMKYLEMTVEGERESRNAFSQEIECVAEQSTTIELGNAFEVGEWPPPKGTHLHVFLTYMKDGQLLPVVMGGVQYGVPDIVGVEDSGETFSISYDGDSSAIVTASTNCSVLFTYASHAYTPMFVFGSGVAEEPYSVAEGQGTYSGGYASRAQGVKTKAYGYASHAEGWKTIAAGDYSHADGNYSISSGDSSHAQNRGTIASGRNQTTIGAYNVEDAGDTYALIIGNGTADDARSNAFTVDWDGSVDVLRKVLSSTRSAIIVHGAPLSDASAPQDSVYGKLLAAVDSDDEIRAHMSMVDSSDGRQGVQIEFIRTVNGNVINHGLFLFIDQNGNRTVYVHDKAAWKNALGITVSDVGWVGNENLVATATDNNQEWSINLVPNGHTGTYWHVWTAAKSTILRCDVDTGRVTMPYEVYSNSRYNVKMGGIQRGVKPSAIAFGNYEFKDKDEKRLGIVEFACGTDGTNDLHLYVLGNIASGDYYSGIIIRKTFENTACANMIYNADSGLLEVSSARFLNSTTIQANGGVWQVRNPGVNGAASNNGMSSGTYYPGFQFLDASDRILSRIEAPITTNGTKQAYWYVRQYNTSGTTTAQKGIRISIAWGATAATYTVDDPANFRSAIGAQAAGNYAPHGWTQKASNTNDNAMTYSLSGCTEVMFAAMAGTTYLGSVILPVSLLHASTYREVYLTGGRTSTGGRAFALKATTTRATVAARIQDTGAVACTWWVFAR